MQDYQMYIDGKWCDAESGERFPSANPYTGLDWARFPKASASDVDRAVQAAHMAFTEGDWPLWTASARGAALCPSSGFFGGLRLYRNGGSGSVSVQV